MSEQPLPLLIKKKDVAKQLSCHVKHVEGLVRAGKLKQISTGPRFVRITRESFLKLIGEQ
jgi:excisionase family DNA binding protein